MSKCARSPGVEVDEVQAASAARDVEGLSAKRHKPQAAGNHDRERDTAVRDPAAWDIVYRMAHGDEEYPDVDRALRTYLGDRYQHGDWSALVDRLLSAEVEDEDPMVIFSEAKEKALGETIKARGTTIFHI
ncbi:hypothetical protein BV22DRAFT_1135609, partial [Leucogyrophana mollusca]